MAVPELGNAQLGSMRVCWVATHGKSHVVVVLQVTAPLRPHNPPQRSSVPETSYLCSDILTTKSGIDENSGAAALAAGCALRFRRAKNPKTRGSVRGRKLARISADVNAKLGSWHCLDPS